MSIFSETNNALEITKKFHNYDKEEIKKQVFNVILNNPTPYLVTTQYIYDNLKAYSKDKINEAIIDLWKNEKHIKEVITFDTKDFSEYGWQIS